MLRLEPPPQRGVPVSKDILDVQKMAKECEQKVGTSVRVCVRFALPVFVVASGPNKAMCLRKSACRMECPGYCGNVFPW